MRVLFYLLTIIICFSGCESKKIEEKAKSGDVLVQSGEEAIEEVREELKLPFYFENNVIHGLTISDAKLYESFSGDKILATVKAKTNVNILDATLENRYEVEIDSKKGFIDKSNIKYFKYNASDKLTLACDVSGFNYNREFFKKEDFEKYLLDYDFNYAIIRLGGRGYGQKGNMYYDDKVTIFVDACEYLGVPYGFYFLDEAVNEEEVHEEYRFVMDRYKTYTGKFNVLPLFIDAENQHGDGRADNIWDERVSLINTLIDDFKKEDIECMLYANGARIETYFKDVNCMYWTAAYTMDDKIPKFFYNEWIKTEEDKNKKDSSNIENSILNTKVNLGDTETIWYSDKYLDKVKAWQFTESAAPIDGIEGTLDLNLIDNDYFTKYCIEIYKK